MTLVNNKYIKVPVSQNVLYHMKNNFLVENSKSPKNYFSWVFTERGHILFVCIECLYIYNIYNCNLSEERHTTPHLY